MSVLITFTSGNSDNTTEAVYGLDIFTKNWCMNCKEVESRKTLCLGVANVSFIQRMGNVL